MCINAVLQKKAKNIVVLNVREISSFTDYMLICSGTTDRQVQAVASTVQEYLKKEGIRPLGVEGKANAEWILLDYDDVVISIFQEAARSFYDPVCRFLRKSAYCLRVILMPISTPSGRSTCSTSTIMPDSRRALTASLMVFIKMR